MLDRNIENILRVILRTPTFKRHPYTNAPNLLGDAKIAREAAEEGIVLLKNEQNVLPLKNAKVALLGNASYDLFIGGTGSGEVYKAYKISLNEGFKNMNVMKDMPLEIEYLNYIVESRRNSAARSNILDADKPLAEKNFTPEQLRSLAEQNDVAILTIGRSCGRK